MSQDDSCNARGHLAHTPQIFPESCRNRSNAPTICRTSLAKPPHRPPLEQTKTRSAHPTISNPKLNYDESISHISKDDHPQRQALNPANDPTTNPEHSSWFIVQSFRIRISMVEGPYTRRNEICMFCCPLVLVDMESIVLFDMDVVDNNASFDSDINAWRGTAYGVPMR